MKKVNPDLVLVLIFLLTHTIIYLLTGFKNRWMENKPAPCNHHHEIDSLKQQVHYWQIMGAHGGEPFKLDLDKL